MITLTFDTLAFAKKLQSKGFSKEQAETLADAQKEAFDQMVETQQLATKLDIMRLENRIAQTEKQITEAVLTSQKYTTNLLLTLAAIIIAAIGIAVAILFNPGPG